MASPQDDMPLKNTFNQDVSQYGGSIVPSGAITSQTLQPQPNVQLPPVQPPNTGVAENASIPSPVPSPEQIVNTGQTSLEGDYALQFKALGDQMSKALSPEALTMQEEQKRGVEGLTKINNDLSAQLQGLNDQAQALQIEANYTIPNQMQLRAEGRGITAGGLAPLTTAELRNNQIKQGQIATQSLTTKAAYYAANNNLIMAKDAAEKAARLAFDKQEADIKRGQLQLQAVEFLLGREDRKREMLQRAQLDERERVLNNQREDFKTGQPLIASALALNPNDPAAQFAAQQAMKLDPSDPQYLNKVMGLVGRFQQDPLDIQYKMMQYKVQQANLNKINQEVKALARENALYDTPNITNPNAGQYKGALSVILGSGKFTKDQKNSVINAVNNGQDPTAVIKNQAKAIMTAANQTKIESYETAQYALDQLSADLSQFYTSGGRTDLFKGNYNTVVNKLGQVGDPKLAQIATRIQQNLQIYRNAVSGTAYSVQEGNDIAAIFPGINKEEALNNAIIKGRMQAFNDGIDGAYRGVLGSTYDALKTSSPVVPPGKIHIIRNGQEGYIDSLMEFNPQTDQRL